MAVEPGIANISLNQGEHIATLEFHVKNTGPVPANLVTVEIAFFDDAEVIEDDNKSKHYPQECQQPQETVIFPGAVHILGKTFDFRPDTGKRLLDNLVSGNIKLRFRMTYRAQSMEYVTVQTEKLEKIDARTFRRMPIQPQRWT